MSCECRVQNAGDWVKKILKWAGSDWFGSPRIRSDFLNLERRVQNAEWTKKDGGRTARPRNMKRMVSHG
jgi:hypothetical protein